MTRDEAIHVIRSAFAHVDLLDVFLGFDELVNEEVAKVVVRDDQLADALRGNGFHAREAAKQSGISVKVVRENEVNRPT